MVKDSDRKTAALMEFLNRDYKAWLDGKRKEAGRSGAQVWEEPDVKQYCSERLSVPYESFNRWKNRLSPVSEINLLRMAIALKDETPLTIYGFDPLPRDLWGILVRLPDADPIQLDRVRSILTGSQEENYRTLSPA